MNTQELIALLGVLLPILAPLGGALYKHLVDALPSNQRQAVVDTVRIATQAFAADPTIAADEASAAAAILKELHLPASPNLTKSLVALFKQDATGSQADSEQGASSVEEVPSVGFAPPAHVSVPPHPGL